MSIRNKKVGIFSLELLRDSLRTISSNPIFSSISCFVLFCWVASQSPTRARRKLQTESKSSITMYFGCIDFYLRTNSCIVPNCQNSLQKAIAFPSPNLSFVLLSPVYSSAFPSYQHIELIDGSIRITATPKR